jgi:hypothetical protein
LPKAVQPSSLITFIQIPHFPEKREKRRYVLMKVITG